jgi:hypothetical protein
VEKAQKGLVIKSLLGKEKLDNLMVRKASTNTAQDQRRTKVKEGKK